MRISLRKQQDLPHAMKGRRLLKREESLSARPVKNTLIRWEETKGGELRIKVPRPQTWIVKVFCKYAKVPPYREVVLDEPGAWTFRSCDGKKKVKEIIEEFARKYNLNLKESEISIIEYLKQLARRRFIGFAIVSLARSNLVRGDTEASSAKQTLNGSAQLQSEGQAFRSPAQSEGRTSNGVKEREDNARIREDNRATD